MSEAAAHVEGRDATHEPHVNYMAKFYWLVGLTTAEVIVAFTLEGGLRLSLLAFLSVWKAGIVLNYFMHLKTERIGLKLMIAFPAVLVCVLVGVFLLDGFFLNYSAI